MTVAVIALSPVAMGDDTIYRYPFEGWTRDMDGNIFDQDGNLVSCVPKSCPEE